MNLATRIYDKVLSLPQNAAREVLHFAEILASRHVKPVMDEAATRDAAMFYARYQADLSAYRFDRDEANAR